MAKRAGQSRRRRGGQSGGINIPGAVSSVGGDIVGRDKIGLSADELLAALKTRGLLQPAETADLQNDPLSLLASRIERLVYWDDVVLPSDVIRELREIVDKSRPHSVGDAITRNNGTQAVFHGPRGTGKRLAAKAIAHDLYMDVYSINYTAVVGHHPIDTASHLQQLFAVISISNAWLIVHDAEIIFSATATAAIADMVQLQGNVIFTTTRLSEIDCRLLDKVAHVVEFPFPDATLREYIWRIAIRPEVPLSEDVDLRALASMNKLSGESIRRAVEQAAGNAAREGRPVTMAHLESAAASMTKIGGLMQSLDQRVARYRA
jgi:SpoVK/Ycf46/Vps4 family AAA+-type ATPase